MDSDGDPAHEQRDRDALTRRYRQEASWERWHMGGCPPVDWLIAGPYD
jgi:hypothetical protein